MGPFFETCSCPLCLPRVVVVALRRWRDGLCLVQAIRGCRRRCRLGQQLREPPLELLLPAHQGAVEEEGDIAQHTGGDAGLLTLQEVGEVELAALGQRQAHLRSALAGQRPPALEEHGDLAAGLPLHAAGQGAQVGRPAGDVGAVDAGHLLPDLHALGLGNRGLVDRDARLEGREGLGVAAGGQGELREELRLGALGDVGPVAVVVREGAHPLGEEHGQGAEPPLGGLLRPRAIQDGGVRQELVVGDAERPHRRGQAVGVGVGDDHRPLRQELTLLHQAGAGRVGRPVGDDGVDAVDLPDDLRRVGDGLLAGAGGVRTIVMVADDHLDALGDQPPDEVGQVGGGGGVQEHHSLGRHAQQGVERLVGGARAEELVHPNEDAGDVQVDHVVPFQRNQSRQPRQDTLCFSHL